MAKDKGTGSSARYPSVGDEVIYNPPARNDGLIMARPMIVSSVGDRQVCSGWVFPDVDQDDRKEPYFVSNANHGNGTGEWRWSNPDYPTLGR